MTCKVSDWRERSARWVRVLGYTLIVGLALMVRSCVRG